MIIISVVPLLAWGSLRRFGKQYSLTIFLIATVITSFVVMTDVRTAGVFRESITPDYDIVHHNSLALFPFVIQKHHNWTAREYFHRVLLIGQEGGVVYEEAPNDDQSEFMHWSLFTISATFCVLGFCLTGLMIYVAELVWWYRLRERE
ncbi:MAG: hypothetical protein ACXAAO_12650 [Candidatus Thorarchaeota archaeon]|jgi:hypothetical protein